MHKDFCTLHSPIAKSLLYIAGVQPQWIQGIRSGNKVGILEKNYLIRNIRLGKNSVVGKLLEKRG